MVVTIVKIWTHGRKFTEQSKGNPLKNFPCYENILSDFTFSNLVSDLRAAVASWENNPRLSIWRLCYLYKALEVMIWNIINTNRKNDNHIA